VFNNGAFGNVQRIQADTFGRNLGVDLHNPNYRTLSDAFGVAYEQVETPEGLRDVITGAAGATSPLLVEVPFGDVPDPWGLIFEPTVEATRAAGDNA